MYVLIVRHLGSISQKVVSLRLIVSVIVSVISKLLIGWNSYLRLILDLQLFVKSTTGIYHMRLLTNFTTCGYIEYTLTRTDIRNFGWLVFNGAFSILQLYIMTTELILGRKSPGQLYRTGQWNHQAMGRCLTPFLLRVRIWLESTSEVYDLWSVVKDLNHQPTTAI